MNRIILYTLITGVLIVMASTLHNTSSSAQTRSPLSLDSDQRNPVMVTKGGRLEQARIMWDFFFNKPAGTRPAGRIPLQALTRMQLLAAPDNTVYRLGHSTAEPHDLKEHIESRKGLRQLSFMKEMKMGNS